MPLGAWEKLAGARGANEPGQILKRVKESHQEVYPNWINLRFPAALMSDFSVVRHPVANFLIVCL